MKQCPCKDCKVRHQSCHSNCPKDLNNGYGYKSWKDEQDELKKQSDLLRAIETDLYEYKQNCIRPKKRRH